MDVRRWWRVWAYPLGAAVALVVGTLDLRQHYELGWPPAVALGVARAAPLLLCRRRPLFAWAAVLVACTVTAAATHPHSTNEPWPWAVSTVLAVGIALAGLGAAAGPAVQVGSWVVLQAAGLVLVTVRPANPGLWALAPMAALSGAALVVADAVRGRDVAREEAAEQSSRRALLEERARIARELHDVVAHHMSVIVVRAGSASYRLGELPPAATEEFGAIAAEARASLGEMRRLLGVLRQAGGAGGEHQPQPGLAEVEALVEGARQAGVPVRVDGGPGPTDLPPAVQLTAYRVVQEALSNVLRHAPGAATTVTLSGDAAALRVTVANDPAPAGARARHRPVERGHSAGTGQGLVGMRERVAVLGGMLDAGPRPDGGYRVAAVLPVPEGDG
jgi:signal transduction histidine kinase